MVDHRDERNNGQPRDVEDSLDRFRRLLAKYKDRAHVVGAMHASALTLGALAPGHILTASIVQADTTPLDQGFLGNRTHCYAQVYVNERTPDTARVWSLKWAFIETLANAAGVRWVSCLRTDDRSDPDAFEFTAVCEVKQATGSWRAVPGSYRLDIASRREETIAKKLEQWSRMKQKPCPADEKLAWAQAAADSDAIQYRKHGLARAESGAKRRAVLAALSIQAGGYSLQDLTLPFLVVSVSRDWGEPGAREALIAQDIGLPRYFGGGYTPPQLGGRQEPAVLPSSAQRALPPPEEPMFDDEPQAAAEPMTVGRALREAPPDDETPPLECYDDYLDNSAPAHAPSQAKRTTSGAVPLLSIEEFDEATRDERVELVVEAIRVTNTTEPRVPPSNMKNETLRKWYEGCLRAFESQRKGGGR